VCSSRDARDTRLRTAAGIRCGAAAVAIDAGPDFRAQMLSAGWRHLDGVVFTHEHKDHTAGLDDVRPFNFLSNGPVDVFATERVQTALRREFAYVFDGDPYPGIPRLNLTTIAEEPFDVAGIRWWPLPVRHLNLPVLGFRVGGIAYITDANALEPLAWDRLAGVDVLVINALRRDPHPSHFTLDEAIAVARRVGARATYLTHLSHQMGTHADLERDLPDGIFAAYDGLTVVSEGESA
jgi:phosphoribosyl 1,2-cyclic phosphate phosphodiesterase